MKGSIVSVSVLKQKAKQIKQERSINQHQALNEAAMEFGFSNYKNYLNELEESQKFSEASQRVASQMLSSQKRGEIFKRIVPLIPVLQNLIAPFAEFIDTLVKAEHSDEALQAVCEQRADLKKYLELKFLRDFLVDEDGEIDFEAPFHVPQSVLLKNLVFKAREIPDYVGDDGESLYIEGEYDLNLEFAFIHEGEDPNGTFNDRQATGYFELVIDRNKNIKIDTLDISWNAW